jgi:hypothetical protein
MRFIADQLVIQMLGTVRCQRTSNFCSDASVDRNSLETVQKITY